MTRDEAFQRYEEALDRITKQTHEAREGARNTLRVRLKLLRDTAHEELKAIRALEQKTRRNK